MKAKSRDLQSPVPFLIAVGFGILISVLPHLMAWIQTGSPYWIADNDELGLYLPTASQAYFNHPFYLSDPVFADARHPTIYPWIQLIPGTLLAKILGLGPLGISILWRLFAGVSIACGWFLIFKYYTKSNWKACGLSIVFLGDGGLLQSQPILDPLRKILNIALDHGSSYFERGPSLLPQWRIITPGLSLIFLQIYFLLLAKVREKPVRKYQIAAGLALGALFWVYFYFWTAAVLALVLCWIADQDGRKAYTPTLAAGVVLGLPSLFASWVIEHQSGQAFLQRSDKLMPIGHFQELLIPRIALLLLMILIPWIWKSKPQRRWLALHALAGLLLINHQLLTGLQIENFHWNYFWGPALTLLVFLTLYDLPLRSFKVISSRALHSILGIAVAIHAGIALGLRAAEPIAHDTVQIQSALADYSIQKQSSKRYLKSQSVLGGDLRYVSLAAVLENVAPLDSYSVVLSPSVSDEEWNARIALNSYLKGQSLEGFLIEQQQVLNGTSWGPWARNPILREALYKERVRDFLDTQNHPCRAIKRFAVNYLALPHGTEPPAKLAPFAERIDSGPVWQIFELSSALNCEDSKTL